MSQRALNLATYGDLLILGEDMRAEILAGEVITAPAPLPRHSNAQRALGRFVGGTLEALQLEDGRWTELGAWDDASIAAIPPFEATSLEVGRLFLPKDE